jgi:hypothetical protein
MASNRQEYRAQWERQFRAAHGVSSGTYYSMRRAGQSRGISGKTFDAVAQEQSYGSAKKVAQIAVADVREARETAAIYLGAIPSGSHYDDTDAPDIDDVYDWWYH